MNYQVLAIKWRPKIFKDVSGQEHILDALSNSLLLGRVHHAYLFSGTRGIGKTTIARLLAKALNCINDITPNPCGKCQNCKDIELGRFIDLIEIDAASKTKVEDTRELLDNVQYASTIGRFKIYLIDEIHMLSKHSFNALLKTLEEPPIHVKFIFATTEPQKIPITILSRCLHFHLQCLSFKQILQKLQYIIEKEQIQFELSALKLISKAANGSMRDALNITDQAIAIGNGIINTKTVSIMLGNIDYEYPLKIIESLIEQNAENIMIIINEMSIRYTDWDSLLIKILHFFHRIAMLQFLPKEQKNNEIMINNDEEEISINIKLNKLANIISPSDIQLYYQIILMGRKDLSFAPNLRIGVEMTLLRALAFHPNKSILSSEKDLSLFKNISTTSLFEENDTKLISSNFNFISDESLQKKNEKIKNKEEFKTKNIMFSKNKLFTSLLFYKQDINFNNNKKKLKINISYKTKLEFLLKIKIIVQKKDSWAAEISKLNLPNITKQLALNSWKENKKESICLHLRSKFSYLNSLLNHKILKTALNQFNNRNIKLIIIEDNNFIKLTPMELQEKIYREKITQLYNSIFNDIHVQKLSRIFDASLDEESLQLI